jgi:hypothetical protein
MSSIGTALNELCHSTPAVALGPDVRPHRKTSLVSRLSQAGFDTLMRRRFQITLPVLLLLIATFKRGTLGAIKAAGHA